MQNKLLSLVTKIWDKGLYKELSWLNVAEQLYGSYYLLCELDLGTFQTHESMWFLYCVALERHAMDVEEDKRYQRELQVREYWKQ